MRNLLLAVLTILFISADAQTNMTSINVGPSDYSIQYAVNSFVNLYNDEKVERTAKEETASQLTILRESYASKKMYPESIVDGWHDVVVTDNLKFCRDAKVRVVQNEVTEFVIDNCIALEYRSTGEIKNGKAVGTILKNSGVKLQVVEVYFVYDLESPKVTDPPIEPGYVCFWSTSDRFVGKTIYIDGEAMEGISTTIETRGDMKEPECFVDGTLTLMMKPGRYNFHALKSGRDVLGSIEIKSGECLKYRLK